LVTFGAVLGANTRFLIYKSLEKINLSNYFLILNINTFSSFLLGLFLSFLPRISYLDFSYQLILFFSIGFLGSLSTFSTLIYDLFDLVVELKFFRVLNLIIVSSTLGIIAMALGFLLGNQ